MEGWVVGGDASSGTEEGFEFPNHYLDADPSALHASGGRQVEKGSIGSNVTKTELCSHVGGGEVALYRVNLKGD